MVFSSSVFLLAFLPAVLVAYFIVPSRAYRNIMLLVASLVFYAWGEPVYILLMIISIAVNWAFACAIEIFREKAKAFLTCDLIGNLAILGFFKYEGFLADNINFVLGSTIPNLDLPLPIGISFYTLQALSYVIDVYRKEVPAQRNPLYLGMYIAMFPQLVAGPIVRYSTIQNQVLNRKENFRDFCAGARLFIIGLSKKVLLANVVAILATKMLEMGGAEIGFIGAWAGLLAFTFQIFFDFSGYSDMAIGLGKMFGFQYLRNFNYPYISKSITEFWRRWHISLSSFFRDYVYIALGGSRVTQVRRIFNLTVVWLLTGFWHGAAWNYVLWGMFYLVLLLLEKYVWGKALASLPSLAQHAYTILVFMLGWLLFWIEDMAVMGEYATAMLGVYGLTGNSTFWELTCWQYWPVFTMCVIASTPIIPWLRARLVSWATGEKHEGFSIKDLPSVKSLSTEKLCDGLAYLDYAEDLNASGAKIAVLTGAFILADICLIALLGASMASVVSGSFNPFIYFRF